MVESIVKEIERRKDEFKDYEFNTLYFGGGTPSVLSAGELQLLLNSVFKNYRFTKEMEFTFEANPDDLNVPYLKDLKDFGINRLSIGIQSFREDDLKLMRRSHSANQARQAIRNSQDLGLSNINIDLIYGVPEMGIDIWKKNLVEAFTYNIKHISAYHLTFESGTVFDHWRKKGRLIPVDEESGLEQFSLLKNSSSENGFLHYEISNFAMEGFFSKHNTNYWKQVPYIGIGPSAHSYSGKSRRWNISSNKKYMEYLLTNDTKYFETEELSKTDLYNEYILTSLRTSWGIDLNEILKRFGNNYVKYTEKIAGKFFSKEELIKRDNNVCLSDKGIFLADFIIREFFITSPIGA